MVWFAHSGMARALMQGSGQCVRISPNFRHESRRRQKRGDEIGVPLFQLVSSVVIVAVVVELVVLAAVAKVTVVVKESVALAAAGSAAAVVCHPINPLSHGLLQKPLKLACICCCTNVAGGIATVLTPGAKAVDAVAVAGSLAPLACVNSADFSGSAGSRGKICGR
jgi:hypothetical protein